MTEVTDRELLMRIDRIGGALADRLLDRFGSAEAVVNAQMASLKRVSGVGSAAAKNINNTTIDSLKPAESQPASNETVDSKAVRKLTAIDNVGDTTAERLLVQFGSLNAVMNATSEELCSVRGVGKSTALHVRSFNDHDSDGPTVQNMVLSSEFGQELLPRVISRNMRGATIKQFQHGAETLVYDPSQTGGRVHLTARGNVVILGAISRTEADELAEVFFENLPSEVPIDHSELDLEVNNVVMTATVDNPVPLDGLAQELHDETEYEPGGFPGLSFTLPDISCTYTLFGNGKVNITGAKSVEEAKSALDTLNGTLNQMDPDELRLPPDKAHERLDEIVNVLEVNPDTLVEAHNNIEVYNNKIWQSSRESDGIAAMALYLASENYTQSEIAETANVSEATIRNALKEFREGTDIMETVVE